MSCSNARCVGVVRPALTNPDITLAMTAVRRVLAGIGALVLVATVWGVAIEPRLLLDDEAYDAELPNLPAGWDGQRVVLIADTQTGMWLDNEAMAREAVEDAVEQRPALALIAGDFVYTADSATVARAVDVFRPLAAAGIPTIAVLGNHDYRLNFKDQTADERLAAHVRRALEATGIRVLENEHVAVVHRGDTLSVVGIGSVWAGHSDPASALAGLDARVPRLVLMHNPQSYETIPGGAAPLALAGHTHGGQVRLPGLPRWSWLKIVRKGEVAADGWIDPSFGAAGNRLYVTRGIGFSTLPVRINCRPELTTITLRRGTAPAPSRTTDS